ncbi:MAG: ADP-forming succinate--CoA ligase subunit beta [Sphingobacteriia bacterium]|nr:ADP-forming succinate--CoA ligase subunit beta [Sphingobacteriia bacterium]
MNIHEYQAKEILRKYGIPVNKQAGLITDLSQLDNVVSKLENNKLYVVKAQIHAGGRGKAGGVKLAKSPNEVKELTEKMFGITLVTHQTGPKGQKVRRIYIEEGSDIKKEYYLSLVLDRATSSITIIASSEGGVDIEEVADNHPEKIIKASIDPATGIQPFHTRKLAFALGFEGEQMKKFSDFVIKLYNAFLGTDASQVEINPMITNDKNEFVALDAKFNFDDNALYRQAEVSTMRDLDEEDPLEQRANNSGLSYVKMDGNIGCMVNGAGLAMSTMDIIKLYGGEPANFLDVGGGANKEKVSEAFRIILSDPEVKGILVNIFGGIMRCDIIAEGVIAAAKEVSLSVPLVVRLAGTNFELGKQILNNSGLAVIAADDLADAAEKIVKAVNKG